MRPYLTNDVNTADYIVDLSNVMRNSALGGEGGADVTRLSAAHHALTIMECDEGVVLYLVADRSLFNKGLFGVDPADLRTLRDWERQGLLEVLGEADERILELSQLTGIKILSNDLFRGWRSTFRWLQGNSSRVVEVIPADGGLVARPVDLGDLPTADTSKFQERDELKRQGLLAGDRRRPRFEVVDRLWRCAEPGCHRYDGQGESVQLPRLRDDTVMCEEHGRQLTDAGPRPMSAPLKVLVDGACVRRFAVPASDAVVLGREPGSGGLDLRKWLGADVADPSLSRRHVRLRLNGERLLVRDLSTYGTGLRKPGTRSVQRLEPEVDYVLHLGDTLILTKRIAITRSGRSFAAELAAAWPEPGDPAIGSPATRPVSGPADDDGTRPAGGMR